MSKFVRSSVLAISVIMLVVIFTGCSSRFVPSSSASPPSSSGASFHEPVNGLVQSNTAGPVTIDVEWVRADSVSLIFNVAMNTHSVDLDGYDLGELAVLRDDVGNEYQPVSWDSAPGGHHRQGRLIFPLPASMGQGQVKYVEIVIEDVADIEEMVLRWEL